MHTFHDVEERRAGPWQLIEAVKRLTPRQVRILFLVLSAVSWGVLIAIVRALDAVLYPIRQSVQNCAS